MGKDGFKKEKHGDGRFGTRTRKTQNKLRSQAQAMERGRLGIPNLTAYTKKTESSQTSKKTVIAKKAKKEKKSKKLIIENNKDHLSIENDGQARSIPGMALSDTAYHIN